MEKEISAIEKFEGKEIVVIHDIRFKGRQAIEWTEVENYLREYVG